MKFDFSKHITKVIPKTFPLTKFFKNSGNTSFAATEPFRLLTNEATNHLRQLVTSEYMNKHCKYSSVIAPYVLRNACKYSEFINDMWASPELSRHLSQIINNDVLVHPMIMERAHFNIQEKPENFDNKEAVFGWHFDSQPYVCIVNISEFPSYEAEGGDTLIKRDDGELCKLTFPESGYAYILKGSVIEHCATAANYKRITMITSLINKDVFQKDLTDIKLAETYSNVEELKQQYNDYRMDRLRIQFMNNPEPDDLQIIREEMEVFRNNI